MYCRNCGNYVAPHEQICFLCHEAPKQGKNYCRTCGNSTFQTDKICINCGAKQAGEGKDWLTTLLLHIFLGYWGVHRFYTGNVLLGLLYLFTGAVCGIMWIYDLIIILTDNYKDADGNLLDKSKY